METEKITSDGGANLPDNDSKGGSKRRFFNPSNIIGIILCVLLLPGFFLSIVLLISSLGNKDLPPNCFGYTPMLVESDSMSPVFSEDDLVLIRNKKNASYSVGDIICYQSNSIYVTHRIVEITVDDNGNTVYITKGDANNSPDKDPVQIDQILGVYKMRIKNMGKTLLFVQTPIGMIVCVMLPFFVVLMLFIAPYLITNQKKNEENKQN